MLIHISKLRSNSPFHSFSLHFLLRNQDAPAECGGTAKINVVVGQVDLGPIYVPKDFIQDRATKEDKEPPQKDVVSHQQTMPKRRAGGIGSRTLRGSQSKSIHAPAALAVPLGSPTELDVQLPWSPAGKTDREIKKKIK